MSIDSHDAELTIDPPSRVCVFVDFWNLALSLNADAATHGEQPWQLDWLRFPAWVAAEAASLCAVERHRHVGTFVYSSFNNGSPGQLRHRNWALNWLGRQPDVTVELRPQVRRSDRCRNCGAHAPPCPRCGYSTDKMMEKGVDAALATGMFEQFVDDRYDIAALVTSDGDLAPVAEFLMRRGRMVVQAGFGQPSRMLRAACVAAIDLAGGRDEIEFRRG